MKLPSFEPFVPKGSDFKRSQRFFQGLGFTITWDVIDYVGFDRDGCSFILQNYDHKEFAEQLMIRVKIESADNFWNSAADKNLVETYGVKVSKPSIQPYGIMITITDMAGVCWYFVEENNLPRSALTFCYPHFIVKAERIATVPDL